MRLGLTLGPAEVRQSRQLPVMKNRGIDGHHATTANTVSKISREKEKRGRLGTRGGRPGTDLVLPPRSRLACIAGALSGTE